MGFSEKQRQVLRFPYTSYDALICDGAVRSGKSSVMSLSFLLWGMGNFRNCAFAICGKSVGSVERNIITPLLAVQYLHDHFTLRYNRGDHMLLVSRGGRENRFYLFGGRDEASYTLIQGITLAGVLLDEVALMPRSFVEQTAEILVQLQPGEPYALVQTGVDPPPGAAQCPASAFPDG